MYVLPDLDLDQINFTYYCDLLIFNNIIIVIMNHIINIFIYIHIYYIKYIIATFV